MRRTCPAPYCGRSYTHDEVTASGKDGAGDRVHIIACSWECLADELHEQELDEQVPFQESYDG